jgi:hypothetical protein
VKPQLHPLLPPTHTKYVFPNSIRCPWIRENTRETEKGNSRAKYVFPNSIPFFWLLLRKDPNSILYRWIGEEKREKGNRSCIFKHFFELYGELAAVREVQKERPNEITATMGTGGKGWGARGQKQKPAVQSNRNGPALLRFAAPAFFLLPRGCRSCSRAAAPPISSFSSPPPPPLLLYDALTVSLLYSTNSQSLMAAVPMRARAHTHTCTPVPRCQ